MPFDHVSASIEDRYALVVRPDGGELVRTPRSRAQENGQIRRARVQLTPEGHATAEVETRYTGNQQDHVRDLTAQRTGRDREQWLHRMIDIPSFEVLRADYSGLEVREASIKLSVALRLPRYAARTGTRLFLAPNLMERWGWVPEAMAERRQPVAFFPYAFTDIDTIGYELPAGFKVEAMAAPVVVEASFGRYQAETVIEADGGLAYHRLLEISEPSMPAEEYEAFRAFLRQVAQADQAQVVLVQEP